MAIGPYGQRAIVESPSRDMEERAWVVRVQQGDGAAFMALFRAYQAPLRAFAAKFVDSMDAAQDVVQDVFLAIWQRRATWHVDASVQLYLFGATRNRALHHARRRRDREVPLDEQSESEDNATVLIADAGAGPYEETCAAELDQAIARAISRLPDRCRRTYVLRWYYHLTYPEIAHILGVSVKTVESQVTAANKVLRTRLRRFR